MITLEAACLFGIRSHKFFVFRSIHKVQSSKLKVQNLIERCSLDGPGGGAEVVVATVLPVDVEQHELLETEGLHIGVIDDVEAEVEQFFVYSCL